MPNYFVGHIDRWLSLSEPEVDFAFLFVKAWIPFNAWYCNHYQNTVDSYCIKQIKTDGNQFRARLIALLQGDFPEALTFKHHLEQLHNLLDQYPIPEADEAKRITFKSICFRENPVTSINPPLRKRNIEYKTEIDSGGNVTAIIINTRILPHATIYTYSHNKYELNHFKNHLETSLNNESQRSNILDCFYKINPKIKENLITNNKNNALTIGNTFFVNNPDHISQAVIHLLYDLRCKIFHGELQPSKDNFSIYEPCYHILRILLKSLK